MYKIDLYKYKWRLGPSPFQHVLITYDVTFPHGIFFKGTDGQLAARYSTLESYQAHPWEAIQIQKIDVKVQAMIDVLSELENGKE